MTHGDVEGPSPLIDPAGFDPRPSAPDEPAPGALAVDLAVDGTRAVEWLAGDIDVASSGRLQEVGTTALQDDRVTALVIDFAKVAFMDSSGLGAIVELHTRASAAGKQLTLRALPQAVSRIFEVTGLDRQFHIEPGDAGRC